MCVNEKCVLFFKRVRLFSQSEVLFLFYFLINLTMTTAFVYLRTYLFLLMLFLQIFKKVKEELFN